MIGFFKKLILLCIYILFVPSVSAEIIYRDGRIGINVEPDSVVSASIKDWNSLKWTNGDKTKLLIDLSQDYPVIGTNGELRIKNGKGNFQPITASNVNIYSQNKESNYCYPLNDVLKSVVKMKAVGLAPIPIPQLLDDRSQSVGYNTFDDVYTAQLFYKQIGLTAASVEEAYPILVNTDEDGKKYIDYTSLIPVLVSSIQELQVALENQAVLIEELVSSKPNQCLKKESLKIVSYAYDSVLQMVELEIEGVEDVESLNVTISTVSGTREIFKIVDSIEKTIKIDVSNLRSGIHVLSLYAHGDLSDYIRIMIE